MKEGRVRGKELGRRSGGKWECKKTRFKKRNRFGICGLPSHVIHFGKRFSGTTFLLQIVASILNRLKIIKLRSWRC